MIYIKIPQGYEFAKKEIDGQSKDVFINDSGDILPLQEIVSERLINPIFSAIK